MRAAKSMAETSPDFALCSSALIEGLAKSGVRTVAYALVRKRSSEPELVGSSAGASVAFTDLCVALAEAPVGAHVREIDVAGFGRVSWKLAELEREDDADFIIFALHEGAVVRPMSVSGGFGAAR